MCHSQKRNALLQEMGAAFQPNNALRVCARREPVLTSWTDSLQGARSHMLTQSLPPIPELSEAGATEPGLHSSRGRKGGREGREVGGEFLLLCALGVSCLQDLWEGWFWGLTRQCCIGQQQLRRPPKHSRWKVFLCKAYTLAEWSPRTPRGLWGGSLVSPAKRGIICLHCIRTMTECMIILVMGFLHVV